MFSYTIVTIIRFNCQILLNYNLVHSSIAHGSIDFRLIDCCLMPTLGIFQQHWWVDIRNQIDKTIRNVKKTYHTD